MTTLETTEFEVSEINSALVGQLVSVRTAIDADGFKATEAFELKVDKYEAALYESLKAEGVYDSAENRAAYDALFNANLRDGVTLAIDCALSNESLFRDITSRHFDIAMAVNKCAEGSLARDIEVVAYQGWLSSLTAFIETASQLNLVKSKAVAQDLYERVTREEMLALYKDAME